MHLNVSDVRALILWVVIQFMFIVVMYLITNVFVHILATIHPTFLP